MVTCAAEGRDGAEAQGSAQASRQRGRRGFTLAGAAVHQLAVDELGEVGGRGQDEGVCQVGTEQRESRAAAAAAAGQESATQEQWIVYCLEWKPRQRALYVPLQREFTG